MRKQSGLGNKKEKENNEVENLVEERGGEKKRRIELGLKKEKARMRWRKEERMRRRKEEEERNRG